MVLTCPTCRITTIPPQLFRVTLLRRLRLPLHLTVRSCRCGLPLDEFGHHRAACAQAGVLSKRGALEIVVAGICREAQGDDERLPARLGFRSAGRCGRPEARSSWTASLSTVALSLQLTPHWCVLSTETAHRWVPLHNRTASCCSPPAVGKRRGCFCLCWPGPRFVARIHCYTSGSSKLGVSGVHCCPVPLLPQSRPQCWSCWEHVAPMVTLQHDVEQDFRFAGLVE